jgi:uncharacterized membrane protein (UPF0127 family)
MLKFRQALASVLLIVLTVSGCDDQPPLKPTSSLLSHQLPTKAQPTLPTIRLWLGAEELITEMALDGVQQMTGMMFRTNMAENAGMIFPLPMTRQASFWMLNCPLSLSAAYIDPEGIIQEIHDLRAFDTNSVTSASDNIRFVLETPEGWFRRHNITVGTAVRSERGSLMQTFFPREVR